MQTFNDIISGRGVEIIDYRNESISLTMPFDKASNNRVSSQIGPRVLIFGRKTKIVTFHPIISIKSAFHQILI